METYSRIGLLPSYGNLQSYWTTTKLWKLSVVLDYYEAKGAYSRIQEQKLISDIKIAAKKGQMNPVKIMAKDLVRLKQTPVSSVVFTSFPLVSSVVFTSFPLVSSVNFQDS
jgi:hypothetical protein